MPLVTSTEMFKKAYDGGYAIGAFNVNNMEIVQGITEACKEEHAPVILQVSKGARAYANHTYLVKLVEAAVAECPEIPIVLHLDHGPDFETCKACIDGGFTSVMIDASSKPFAENIEITRKVVEYAHDHGVVVEAELGTLAGIEDDVKVADHAASYTRPEEVEEFVAKTGCDSLAIAIGTMFSTGGNAVISKYLGEGNTKRACQCLTQFVLFCVSLSIVLVVLSILFASPISRFLGATDILIDDAVIYLRIVMAFAPACILQTLFQSYFVTAGHPGMGLGLMIVAGCTNAALDYVFIAAMHMGIAGAALATGIGQCIPAVAGVVFFLFTKKELRFTRCGFYPKETAKAAFNGSSEMVTELSTAFITFLFNIILLRLAGEHGVAAITILLYGEFLFNGFYLGFAIGISPIIGFQYGAQNRHELRRLYKIAFLFAAGTSLFMALLAFLLSGPITSVFTKDPQTYVLAVAGFKLFAVNFLFSGLNITSSGFFTALSNGKTSAIISFCRTLLFTTAALLLLPRFLGITGAWIAMPVAELCTLLVSIPIHVKYFLRPGKHNYLQEPPDSK